MPIDDSNRPWRVLICEDEFLLAMDLAQQLEAYGAQIVATLSNLADLQTALDNGEIEVDVAFLDVQLVDGKVYDLVPQMEKRGIGVVFCSGYAPNDRPASLSHLPWLGKPYRGEDILEAMDKALAARSA